MRNSVKLGKVVALATNAIKILETISNKLDNQIENHYLIWVELHRGLKLGKTR